MFEPYPKKNLDISHQGKVVVSLVARSFFFEKKKTKLPDVARSGGSFQKKTHTPSHQGKVLVS